MIMCTDQHR